MGFNKTIWPLLKIGPDIDVPQAAPPPPDATQMAGGPVPFAARRTSSA
jgi:hypothetical protein